MLINLLSIFDSTIRDNLRKTAPEKPINFDEKSLQSSFELPKGASVKIVKDASRTNAENNKIYKYTDLPQLELNEAERAAVITVIEKLKENPKFYDGDQLLVTQALYDDSTNTIYLECKQTKFSTLSTLGKKLFPAGSSLYSMVLYKTGVMTPFITNDGYSAFFERKADGLYSSAAGFCEPIGEEKDLNGAPAIGLDAFQLTGIIEGIEELLGRASDKEKFEEFMANANEFDSVEDFTNALQQFARVKFALPNISSVSFRKVEGGGIGTIEFVAPIELKCSSETLNHLLSTNQAPDKHEHTDKFSLVPLDSSSRAEAIDFLSQNLPGKVLYHPMLASIVGLANEFYCGETISPVLPFSRTLVINVESLIPQITHEPSILGDTDFSTEDTDL